MKSSGWQCQGQWARARAAAPTAGSAPRGINHLFFLQMGKLWSPDLFGAGDSEGSDFAPSPKDEDVQPRQGIQPQEGLSISQGVRIRPLLGSSP